MQKSTVFFSDNNNNNNNNVHGATDDDGSSSSNVDHLLGGCACCAFAADVNGPQHNRNEIIQPPITDDDQPRSLDDIADTDDEDDDDDDAESLDTIEQIVRRDERDESIRLVGVRCEAGSQPGDNYMSVVRRVHAIGTHGNGKAFKRTMIVKRPILRRSRRQLFRCDEAFGNEIAAFNYVVPDMIDFAQQQQQPNSSGNTSHEGETALPFPRCLFAGTDASGELVVLEDLRRSGFTMVDRLRGLDFAHARLVMQKLGQLHGVSVAMRTSAAPRFHQLRQDAHEIVYCAEAAAFYATSLNSSVREALASLRAANTAGTPATIAGQTVPGSLTAAIACVERLADGRMYELMSRAVRDCAGDWSVICHGDLWVNNLMFRYAEEEAGGDRHRVADVRLIDLQTVRCASPAIDLLHFLYTSTERSMRAAHLDALLQCYADSVLATVAAHGGCDGVPDAMRGLAAQYTVPNLRAELRSKIAYALGISMWLLPAVTFHPDRIPDLNTLTLGDLATAKQETVMLQMQTPEYHRRMRDVVLEFEASGYFEGMGM